MRLHIHSIGTLSRGVDEPLVHGTGSLESIPISDYAKPGLRRKFGKLATICYVAASRAIETAGVEDADGFAIVSCTSLGEAGASLDILTQIHESRGKMLSPRLVPNSVHNSPAGHISIGKKNHCPSITVSQGRLSAAAALVVAEDMIGIGLVENVLVVCGDEADDSWSERLEELGASVWSRQVAEASLQEGAVALMVGREPGGMGLGTISARLGRVGTDPDAALSFLKKSKLSLGPGAAIRVHCGDMPDGVAKALKVEACGSRPGTGSARTGALVSLAQCIQGAESDELFSFGAELGEIGVIHWER